MMRRPFFRIGLLLFAAGCCFEACFDGSETGNPIKGAAGVFRTAKGLPAARTQVYLLPSDFNTLDFIAKKAAPRADTTDDQGRFHFTGIDSGIYNLEAVSLVSGARARLQGIRITQGVVQLPGQNLQPPGAVMVALRGAVDTTDGYIYVTGSTFHQKIASAAGNVRLDSIPVGTIDSIQYGNPEGTVGPVTFAWDLAVKPDSTTSAPAPYLSWKYTRTLVLNTTAGGADVPGTVTRFPLLVRLSQANFDFSSARSNGSDLRFTNAAGDPLPCAVEHWDSAGARAEAWVRVDTVFGDSIQTLHMLWGQTDTSAPFPTDSVFAAADGYAGVWHLDESPGGGAPQYQDASGANNPGIAVGYTASAGAVPGLVESGMGLDGQTQFAGTQRSFTNPQVFTLAAWFKTTTTNGGKILDFTDVDTSTTSNYRDRHIFMTPNGTVHFSVYPPDSANQSNPNPGIFKTVDSPTPLNDGAWHQVVARLSASGQDLFVDGLLVASDPASTVAENITGYWRWGYGVLALWAPPGISFYFQGTLDEIWVTLAARSDDFIKLSFENQQANSPLLQFP